MIATDVAMTAVVVLLLLGATAAMATRYPAQMRRWIWFAFLEYMLCAVAQMFYVRVLTEGGDAYYYAQGGAVLARGLEQSFEWAAGELGALLIQRPSAFDGVVSGAGTNTGSMFAVAAWLIFLVRGSEIAVQVLVAGLSMFGALNIFNAFHHAYPEGSPRRLFFATVLFPSVAFWTSALHKEAFCILGMGAVLAAWRAASRRQLRALLYAPLGVGLILVFRAPALPPLAAGLAAYLVFDRLKRARGADAAVLAPVYLALGIGVLALSLVFVSRVAPSLSLDQLGESVALQRNAWAQAAGGSTFADRTPVDESAGAQLAHVPLALLNSLFRPQLFDVNNPLALISAIEMTIITWLVIRGVRQHGVTGVVGRIQRSPFLLMCAVVTVVGCMFVGLVTLNFGSLARYRVPFLPFYGALVAALTDRVIVRASSPVRPVRHAEARAGRRGRTATT